jgi:glycerophosphoryl diester phosphodiesterase
VNELALNFAHRGSLTEAPENTLPAMQKALAHDIRGIELDVQLTRDNQLVVIHDQKLARFNKKFPGYVKDYTLKEIKQIDIGSSFSNRFKGVPLATLDEILEIIPKNIVINVEIKNIPVIYKGIEQVLIDCLKNHQLEDEVIISSFDHESLKTFQNLMPSIPVGLLFYYRLLKPWQYAKYSGLNIYSVHPMQNWTDRELIEECHSLGYKVFPYTVNSENRYEQLLDLGVDGVFSNNPDIFTKV